MYCLSACVISLKGSLRVVTILALLLSQISYGNSNNNVINFREYYAESIQHSAFDIPEADQLLEEFNISIIECFSLCITYPKCLVFMYNVFDGRCILRKIKQLPGASSFINIPAEIILYMLRAPGCPTSSGYIYQPELRICFKISTENKTWDEAADICNNDHGQLIHLKTFEINKYILTLLLSSSLRNDWFHIGICKEINTNKFIWQNGEAIIFSDWKPNSPDNYGGRQKCVSLDPRNNLRWNDVQCDVNVARYICEIVVL